METILTVGRVARGAGVAASAVRYYDRIGLLKPAGRHPLTRYRQYGASAVAILRFVRSAQRFGFTLAEIRAVLRADRGGATCARVAKILAAKQAELDGRIRQLKKLRSAVAALRRSCERALRAGRCSPNTVCPIVEDRYEGPDVGDAVSLVRGMPAPRSRPARRRLPRGADRRGVLLVRDPGDGVE